MDETLLEELRQLRSRVQGELEQKVKERKSLDAEIRELHGLVQRLGMVGRPTPPARKPKPAPKRPPKATPSVAEAILHLDQEQFTQGDVARVTGLAHASVSAVFKYLRSAEGIRKGSRRGNADLYAVMDASTLEAIGASDGQG